VVVSVLVTEIKFGRFDKTVLFQDLHQFVSAPVLSFVGRQVSITFTIQIGASEKNRSSGSGKKQTKSFK
jgi:hypothetical protein